jgi:hypothetical protein
VFTPIALARAVILIELTMSHHLTDREPARFGDGDLRSSGTTTAKFVEEFSRFVTDSPTEMVSSSDLVDKFENHLIAGVKLVNCGNLR